MYSPICLTQVYVLTFTIDFHTTVAVSLLMQIFNDQLQYSQWLWITDALYSLLCYFNDIKP